MTIEILLTVLSILFIHYIADFVVQTEWQAKNKSKDIFALTEHVFDYTCIWAGATVLYYVIFDCSVTMVCFPLITFVCHWITDFFTSRWTSKLAMKAKESGNYHNFFVVIGLDQILHYIQLFVTFYLLY